MDKKLRILIDKFNSLIQNDMNSEELFKNTNITNIMRGIVNICYKNLPVPIERVDTYNKDIVNNSTHEEVDSYQYFQVFASFDKFIKSFEEKTSEKLDILSINDDFSNFSVKPEPYKIWKGNYDAIICNSGWDNFLNLYYYDLAYSKGADPYSQKNKHRVYSEEFVPLVLNSQFKFKIQMSRVEINGAVFSIKTLMSWEKVPLNRGADLFDDEFLDVIENEIMNGFNPLNRLFDTFGTESTGDRLIDIWKNMLENLEKNTTSINVFVSKIILLLHPNNYIYKKIQQKFEEWNIWTPWYFEFHTKDFIKKIPLWMKNQISEEICKFKNVDKFASFNIFKKNASFSRDLDESASIFKNEILDISKEFPDNSLFYNGYDEHKVTGYDFFGNIILTKKEYGKIVEYFDEKFRNIDKCNDEIKRNGILEKLDDITEANKNIIYNTAKKIIENNFSILRGIAGSGKTLTASLVIESILDYKEQNVIFVAPTHKAKEVLENLSIEYFDKNDRLKTYTFDKFISISRQENDFSNSTLIIDEFSMIGANKFSEFLKTNFSEKFKRLVLIGDEEQLPPINSPSIIDLILLPSNNKVMHELRKPIRQNPNSSLYKDVILKVRGDMKISSPSYHREYKDLETFVDIIKNIPNETSDYRILTPVNEGVFGRKIISDILSDTSEDECDFIVGERMIILEESPVYKDNIYINKEFNITKVKGNNIFETDIKYKGISDFNFGVDLIWRVNDDNNFEFDLNQMIENDNFGLPITRAKVQTIHSSQGSTFENVYVIIPPNFPFEKSKLYTAISRAKSNLVIIVYHRDSSKYIEVE